MRRVVLSSVVVSLLLSACSGGSGSNVVTDSTGNRGGNAGSSASGSGGGSARGGRGPRGPAEVTTIVLAPQRAAVTAELPGRTVALRIAQVRPQVTGIIQKRLFTEGSLVKAGQPLYQLDPGTYRAARDSAAAAVAKAEAQRRTAQLRADRYTKLAAAGVISQQDRDDVLNSVATTEADVGTARAALQSAEINLNYTRIVAPISGRIDVSNVTEGALVTANQTAELTTVQQLDPIYVDLTQSADELLRLRQQFSSGELKRVNANRVQVRIRLSDGTTYPHPGTLEFTGVSVGSGTGSITLRTSVPNPNGQLLPGMFVRALLEQGINDAALLAPQRSVMRDQNGDPYVFTVDAAGKVQQRVITTGGSVGENWLVTSGLAAGERLVVEGMQRIKDGDTVKAPGDSAGAAAGAPAAGSEQGGSRGKVGTSGSAPSGPT